MERQPIQKNTDIEKLMNDVSSSRMSSTIYHLVGFKERFTHSSQNKAAIYLYNEMKQYLPDTTFHEYEHSGVVWKNVVGTIRGKKNPEQVVIVCAHLDSKSEKPLVYAPGADDDASGSAAVLEIARLLSDHEFDKTIKFIFFSRESEGQDGSKAYLRSIKKGKEKILAAISMDMIAYGKDQEDIDLVTRPKFSDLVYTVDNVAFTYGFKTKRVINKACY
jgi:bacterial leucyl aminopeptidase